MLHALERDGVNKADAAAPLGAASIFVTTLGSLVAPNAIVQFVAWKGVAAAGLFCSCCIGATLAMCMLSLWRFAEV